MKQIPIYFSIPLFLVWALPQAGAQNIEEGYALAKKYCARCHQIGATGPSNLSKATPFREFPKKWSPDELKSNVFNRMLTGVHPKLPKTPAEPAEFQKIIDYIRTLLATKQARADAKW